MSYSPSASRRRPILWPLVLLGLVVSGWFLFRGLAKNPPPVTFSPPTPEVLDKPNPDPAQNPEKPRPVASESEEIEDDRTPEERDADRRSEELEEMLTEQDRRSSRAEYIFWETFLADACVAGNCAEVARIFRAVAPHLSLGGKCATLDWIEAQGCCPGLAQRLAESMGIDCPN